MKAVELFLKCLENEGVEYIFGIPGEEIWISWMPCWIRRSASSPRAMNRARPYGRCLRQAHRPRRCLPVHARTGATNLVPVSPTPTWITRRWWRSPVRPAPTACTRNRIRCSTGTDVPLHHQVFLRLLTPNIIPKWCARPSIWRKPKDGRVLHRIPGEHRRDGHHRDAPAGTPSGHSRTAQRASDAAAEIISKAKNRSSCRQRRGTRRGLVATGGLRRPT